MATWKGKINLPSDMISIMPRAPQAAPPPPPAPVALPPVPVGGGGGASGGGGGGAPQGSPMAMRALDQMSQGPAPGEGWGVEPPTQFDVPGQRMLPASARALLEMTQRRGRAY